MDTRRRVDPAELLHKDHYTPEELADLLDMPIYLIRHAARTGELKAFIADHRILSLRRADVIRWLEQLR